LTGLQKFQYRADHSALGRLTGFWQRPRNSQSATDSLIADGYHTHTIFPVILIFYIGAIARKADCLKSKSNEHFLTKKSPSIIDTNSH